MRLLEGSGFDNIGHLSWVIGPWSFVIGHLSLVIGHWSLGGMGWLFVVTTSVVAKSVMASSMTLRGLQNINHPTVQLKGRYL
jgi:hypothetical protein